MRLRSRSLFLSICISNMYHINRYANLHKNFLISNISALLFHVLRIIPPTRASVPCVARRAVYGGAERLCINIHMRVHIYSFGTSSTPRESPVSHGRLPPAFLCAYFRCMVMWLTFSALPRFARLLGFSRHAEEPLSRCGKARSALQRSLSRLPEEMFRRSGKARSACPGCLRRRENACVCGYYTVSGLPPFLFCGFALSK